MNLLPEVRNLQEAIQRSQCRKLFTIEWKVAVQEEDFRRHILDIKPQIIHYCGHGTKEGLVIHDEKNQAKLLSNDFVADLLKNFTNCVECLVLNACETEPLAIEVTKHINYAIGMNREVQDQSAITFSQAFYDAIGADKGIEEAFEIGKNALKGITSSGNQSRKLNAVKNDSTVKTPIQNHEYLTPVLKINPNPHVIEAFGKSYKEQGLGVYDKTRVDNSHFQIQVRVINNKININDFFIKPSYSINLYNSLPEIDLSSNLKSFLDSAITILYEQKFLMIAGDYGCGKTFLSKAIQYKLMAENKEDVIFIKCSDFSDGYKGRDYSLFLEDAKKRKRPSSKLFIIFDGFEEVNYLQKSKADIRDHLLKHIIKLSREEDFYVVLNTRKTLLSANSSSEDLLIEISLQVFDEIQNNEFKFLHINYFSKSQIGDFLDSFANEMGKVGFEARLSYPSIKKINKKILKACENPLFLFMLNLFFYENQVDISQAQIFSVYEEFVKSTIRGKFQGISSAINELSHDYERYLFEIASLISKNNTIQSSESDYDEWQLDSNQRPYSISLKKLSPEITALAKHLEENIYPNLEESRLPGNVLSCYFFEISNKVCYFKDNNILFFFLAKKWMMLLEDVWEDDASEKNTEDAYKKLIDEGITHINSTIFDFIIRRIRLDKKLQLQNNLINFIQRVLNKKLLFLFENSEFSDSDFRIRTTVDFVLLILFMNFNNKGYHDFPDFFDWIDWYNRICSSFIPNCGNTLKSMFRRISLYNLNISKISLEGCNFDDAKISDSKFNLVSFIETRMNKVSFDAVDFELCFIENLYINESFGNITFNNSRIISLRGCSFAETGINKDLILEFNNCYIKEIKFEKNSSSDSTLSFINLEFNNCNIEKIIFRWSRSEKIHFYQTRYNLLDIEHSQVKLIELEKTLCSNRIFTGNPSSEPEVINDNFKSQRS